MGCLLRRMEVRNISIAYQVFSTNRRALNRLSSATIMILTITNNPHDVILCQETIFQPACWYAYFQAPKNVATFSASQIKKPIIVNDKSADILNCV